MNSYLLIGGAIQPDTTRESRRSRLSMIVAAFVVTLTLTAVVVKSRTFSGPQPTILAASPANK